MQKTITAQEARETTANGLKKSRRDQFEDIMAGILATVNSPHPKYYFVYDGYIEAEVKDELKSLGYKVMPPMTIRNEVTTQIEW